MQKAFDSVQWSFLESYLIALRFPPTFIHWLLECVTNVTFRLQFNGRMHPPFPGKQGLRQGDPLSPLLFVLTMDYFSRIMRKISTNPGFSYHPNCRKLRLTHLMFADDLLIFSKANISSLMLVQDALQEFRSSTGLQANSSKSQLILGGCSESLHSQCLQLMQMAEAHLPIRYLGVPITSSPLTMMDCNLLVDKITARIRIWSSRHLSYAGRIALINSVLFGLFNYWATIFLMPQKVISRITSLCRNFLWGGKEDHSKPPPPIAWKTVCQAKKHGGLGIKDFEAWNNALIAKLVWAVATKKDVLWVKWVHGRYLKHQDWWSYNPPLDCSWTWKKICNTKEKFKSGCCGIGLWDFQGSRHYTPRDGYRWLKGGDTVPWHRLIWSRASIPRHAFIAWIFM